MSNVYDSIIKNNINKVKPKIFENFMEKSSYNYDHDDYKVSDKNNDYDVYDQFGDRKIIDYSDNANKEDEEINIKKLTNDEHIYERLYDNVQYDPMSGNVYGGEHDVINKYIYTTTPKSNAAVDNTKNNDNKNNYKVENIILTNKDEMLTDNIGKINIIEHGFNDFDKSHMTTANKNTIYTDKYDMNTDNINVRKTYDYGIKEYDPLSENGYAVNYKKTTIDEHGLGDVDNNYVTATTEKSKSKVHESKMKYNKNTNKMENIYANKYDMNTDSSNVGETYGYGIKEHDPYTITVTTPKSQKSKVHDSKTKSDKSDKKTKIKYNKDKDLKPKKFSNFMEKSSFNYDDSDDDDNKVSDINIDYSTVNHHGNHKVIDYYDEDRKINTDNVLGFGTLSNVKSNRIGYGFADRSQNDGYRFGDDGSHDEFDRLNYDSVINDENHRLQGGGHIDNNGFGYGSGGYDINGGYGYGIGAHVGNNGRFGFGGGGHDANGGYGYGGYNGHIFSHHYNNDEPHHYNNNDEPSHLKKSVRLMKKFDKRLISAISASENLKIGKFSFVTLLISYLLSRYLI